MTEDKARKIAARQRMAETGEPYSVARRAVEDEHASSTDPLDGMAEDTGAAPLAPPPVPALEPPAAPEADPSRNPSEAPASAPRPPLRPAWPGRLATAAPGPGRAA